MIGRWQSVPAATWSRVFGSGAGEGGGGRTCGHRDTRAPHQGLQGIQQVIVVATPYVAPDSDIIAVREQNSYYLSFHVSFGVALLYYAMIIILCVLPLLRSFIFYV